MKQSWLNSVFPIAAIFSFRMLGLFMLIPVFSVYATHLNSATPALIGLALGSYGLTQGLLQIPFGMLSDRFGRKPILTLGLMLFAAGSICGALTDSIYGMIIARTLQGTGAIGSVLIALLADLTPDEQRTKAMAVIGVTIGLSFSLAMIISPTLTHYFGLSGVFYFTSILAGCGLVLLLTVIPTPTKEPFHIDSEASPKVFKSVLSNRHLQRLNASIFLQHLILTATFFAIPLVLQQQLGHLTHQWHFYLALIFSTFIMMVPIIIVSEKKRLVKVVFLYSVAFTALSQFVLAYHYESWLSICGSMFAYFLAFNILEATIPSLVSKQASTHSKGTAMGIYSSSQFLGIFAGGLLAGLLYQFFNLKGIFLFNGIISLLWLSIASTIQPHDYHVSLVLSVPKLVTFNADLVARLNTLKGVLDVNVSLEENVIYLKINKALYQEGSARLIINEYC